MVGFAQGDGEEIEGEGDMPFFGEKGRRRAQASAHTLASTGLHRESL